MNNTNNKYQKVKEFLNCKTNGFTLVELIIVIAVIAILATILVPTFSSVITKANETKIKENARNRYIEYFINYGNDTDFIDDVIIKQKEIHCVIFINGEMQDTVYSLQDAINEMRIHLNNQNLNAIPNEKYKDVLILSEEEYNIFDQGELIGFAPLTDINDLKTDTEIVLTYQLTEMIPDFTFLGQYNSLKNTFVGVKDLNQANILILEKDKNSNYWYIKEKNTNLYLYFDFSSTEEGKGNLFLEKKGKNNSQFLWEINIENGDIIIRNTNMIEELNYYLIYDIDFICSSIIQNPIKVYLLMYID